MPELPLDEAQLIAGKYRVERTIGSGAMGVVVSAWHQELAQRVAVKFVRPEAMTMQDAEARFRREARAAARIRSEHVGRVFDVGVTEGGLPYMVMEFLDGHDLSQELAERGPLPIEEAVGMVLQTIEALAEAHAAGIIHRDLKPANLFLAVRPDHSRIVKVLDFGVSKAGDSRPGDLALTQAATLIGSPLYMSPEQMRSARDVDGRSDIWSLGVILFELICGRPPFVADSVGELMDSMQRAAPTLRQFRSDASEALERVVARCLQRSPADRYADVAALARALSDFAPSMRVHAERARRVLGNGAASSSARISLSATEISPSDTTPSRNHLRPTVAAWGNDTKPSHHGPLRRILIAAGVLGVLLAGGYFASHLLSGDGVAPQAPASAKPSSALHAAGAPPTNSALAVPAAPPLPTVAPSSAAPSVAPAPAASQVAPVAAKKVAVKPHPQRPPKPTVAAPAAPSPAEPTNAIPDFGGRR